jgi:L-fucose mutarotase
VRCDGHGVPEILSAILKLMPLDNFVKQPVSLMAAPEEPEPVIWGRYREIIEAYEGKTDIETVERFAFYERAKKAYAVVATGEAALYANVILKKGVVK